MDLLTLALAKQSGGGGQVNGGKDPFVVKGTLVAGVNNSITIQIDKTLAEIHEAAQDKKYVYLLILEDEEDETGIIVPLLTEHKDSDSYTTVFQTTMPNDNTIEYVYIVFLNSTTGLYFSYALAKENDTKPFAISVTMSANEQHKLVMATNMTAKDLFEETEKGRSIKVTFSLGEGTTSTNIIPITSYKIESDEMDTIYYFECLCDQHYYSRNNGEDDIVIFTEE